MKQTIYLKGTITTDTPYATSPEGCRGRNDEQLLPKLPVNIGGAIKMQPYIPAAGLKGKLRRAAAHVILDRFIDAGKTLTFEDWLLLACGGVKGSEREDIDPRDRARIIDQSALLSLFGAGASPAGGMVGAKLHMFPALPQGDVETAFVKGTRAHEDKRPVLGEILPPEEMGRVALYSAANRDRSRLKKDAAALAKKVRDEEKVAAKGKPTMTDEELSKLRETAAQAKVDYDKAVAAQKEIGSDVSLGRPLPGYEVIPAGLDLPHEMQLVAVTAVEAGLFIEALDRFALDPVIGAHTSSGCGRISAHYDVMVRQQGERQHEVVGRLSFGGLDGLVAEGDAFEGWRNAWTEKEFVPDHYRAAA